MRVSGTEIRARIDVNSGVEGGWPDAHKAVRSTWTHGTQFHAVDKQGNLVTTDAKVGEGDFSPADLLLAALAGCTGINVVGILRKARQQVSGLTMTVTGEQADDWPRQFTSIHTEYLVTGTDVRPSAVERAIELSETRYCTVANSLRTDCQLTSSYRIVEDATNRR